MIYILDTADIDAIKHCNEYYPLAGVTTNPSIIAKEKSDFWTLIGEIRSIIGPDKMLHVQATEETAEKIVEEAKMLRDRVGGDFYLKIPICEEGLKATMMLKKLGIKVTMTAIITPAQALIAARAGADFVAPYVNRLDSILSDGTRVVTEIVEEFKLHGIEARVLAASFKNAEQVHKCALAGCHSATVTADIMKSLISHPMTDAAIDGFKKDWHEVYGEQKILDF
ncbi:MAG: fructose-6-phosphate aldolase [Ruminococcaceae bacterium]|nr:fructose-6-phosphate aldolase [Oscillospiraceae bacterium]